MFLYLGCAHTQSTKHKLNEYMNALSEQQKFSGSVLVAKEGEVLLSKGYGMANYELDVPNHTKSVFRLASVSKQFTAMAIMLLQEQGLLNVHDTISKHIPDYPNGDKITIHHLLTHSSGIHDLGYLPTFREENIKPHTIEEVVNLYKNFPLKFNPGEKYSYSNSGYILLSYIIEKVSHKTFEAFLSEYIFTPLHMYNSGYDNSNTVIKNRASGYKMVDDKLLNSDYIHMSFPSGAGALYSTVDDLYLWDQALYNKSVFKKEIISTIFTPHIAIDDQGSYGYGWGIHTLNGRNVVDHSGGIEGFSTKFQRYLDDKVSIIILGNIEGLDRYNICKNLAAIVFGEKYILPKKRVSIGLDPKVYDEYVGTYKHEDGFLLSIIKEDNRLFAKPDGQRKIELFPESKTEFFHKMIDVQITFIKDDFGKISRLVLRSQKDNIYEKIGYAQR